MKNEKIIEVLKRMIIFCYAFTPADSTDYAVIILNEQQFI